ncbi:outer membrane lipoprotein [Escherichia coli]|nr:outer membrane lipoprotein [Escherichia coli]
MIKHLVAPLIFTSLILTGCQSPQGKFTPEQVAAMQSYGFTESAGDWSLAYQMPFCSQKMTTNCSRKASNRSKPWQPNWPRQG